MTNDEEGVVKVLVEDGLGFVVGGVEKCGIAKRFPSPYFERLPCLGSGRREGRWAVVCAFGQNGPCNSSHLVGQSDDRYVAMASCRKAGQPLAVHLRFGTRRRGYGLVRVSGSDRSANINQELQNSS